MADWGVADLDFPVDHDGTLGDPYTSPSFLLPVQGGSSDNDQIGINVAAEQGRIVYDSTSLRPTT